MTTYGGGMRCVYQVRASGVVPIPAADARQQDHKSGPKTRRPHHNDSREAGVHRPKNTRVRAEPGVREARFVFLVYLIQINRDTRRDKCL